MRAREDGAIGAPAWIIEHVTAPVNATREDILLAMRTATDSGKTWELMPWGNYVKLPLMEFTEVKP
jgi:hypothetical protein